MREPCERCQELVEQLKEDVWDRFRHLPTLDAYEPMVAVRCKDCPDYLAYLQTLLGLPSL